MAGTQSITSQWVETGDLSKTNWLDVGKCSLLGGATGFVTGFVGAGAGGIITSKLTGAAITAPLVNSSSTVTRVATHFAIGSVSEVTTGTISRFAGGMINTCDVGESLRQAFDPKSMLFDAALGGAVNSVQGINKPQQSFADLMSPEDAARYNAFLENGSNSGFTPQEIKAFDKLDEALLMERIDYEEVLSARKSAIPNSNGTMGNVQGLKKPQQSFADMMSPEDASRYNQYWDDVAHAIDTDTRVRLNQWDYRPDAELYLQYQDVYDNPKFFDPQTGEIHYPGTNGDINTDGFTNGVYHVETLTSGTIIDRYGSNGSGRYFSPDGTPYAERALPPFMERQPYNRYRVVQPFVVKAGEIAPWFNQPGKGIQFLSDYSLKYLLKHGYIEILK